MSAAGGQVVLDVPPAADEIELPAPEVRYADPDRPGAAHGYWLALGSRRSWSDGRLELTVEREDDPAAGGATVLVVRARALAGLALRWCAVRLRFEAPAPPAALDASLHWMERVSRLSVGATTPLVVRWRGAHGSTRELRTLDRTAPARVEWSGGTLTVTLVLDAAALHPRWRFDGGTRSVAARRWEPGDAIALRLLLSEGSFAGEMPVVAAPLPGGHEGAFVLTDHCDFDTVPLLRAFLEGREGRAGWLGRGLRMTKGVFAVPPARAVADPVPTLADPDYLALVERLHEDGSEIAPHALAERGTLEPSAFRAALAALASRFAPRTWIDHGLTIPYCYTMGGADDPAFDLLGALRGAGIGTMWAYHDVPVSAAASLDMTSPAHADLGAGARRAAAHLGAGRPLVAAYYARSALLSRLQGRTGDVAGRVLTLARDLYFHLRSRDARGASATVRKAVPAIGRALVGTPDAAAEPHDRRELLECAAIAYGERGVPLADAEPDELVLLATQEVQHTSDSYTPGALGRLADERGVHVGHCYLLNRLPYLAGVFEPGGGEGRLGAPWLDALDALERLVRTGRMWNPAAGELAGWLRDRQRVSLFPDAAGAVLLRHSQSTVVRGFTLLVPAEGVRTTVSWGDRPPAGERDWGDWRAVWGDVPPNGIRVAWRPEP